MFVLKITYLMKINESLFSTLKCNIFLIKILPNALRLFIINSEVMTPTNYLLYYSFSTRMAINSVPSVLRIGVKEDSFELCPLTLVTRIRHDLNFI